MLLILFFSALDLITCLYLTIIPFISQYLLIIFKVTDFKLFILCIDFFVKRCHIFGYSFFIPKASFFLKTYNSTLFYFTLNDSGFSIFNNINISPKYSFFNKSKIGIYLMFPL